ncbi:MAG: arginine--tRNA ligase [Ignavibacteriae bacterium]|nr:MAG: arginine--tRNA ligase [Ignavibacteriota bacterium]
MTEYLKEKIKEALHKLDVDGIEPVLERPKEESHGDYSTNAAMLSAKKLKKNPREIAKNIIDNLQLDEKYISKIEIAGAGFINFFVSPGYYIEQAKDIINKRSEYGKLEINKGKSVNIEWVSVNPTGPMHAGHGRHIALGKAVANLLKWSGYTITKEYYYNDAGKQMENLAKSVYARYRQMFEPDYPFPETGYVGEYIIEIAKIIKDEYGDKLLNSENDFLVFKTAGENWCFKSIRNTLRVMGIEHDKFFSERSLYDDGKIEKLLSDFKQRNLSYEKDGAVWLKTSELMKDKKDAEDKVIVKSTGEPTYRLPDMAYHIDKLNRGYDAIIDVFGADHGDTYKEVLAGVAALGYDASKIRVIIHQMVTFMQEGKPVKMSKRSDNVYYLDDLIEDVGADVAQFFFVMRSANTHLDFDIALAKEQSDKNPVFYLQYAHARISGILRNAKEVFGDYSKDVMNANTSLLKNEDEVGLAKILTVFTDVVRNAVETYEPHKIITYLNEVAEAYHRFYHNNRVINAEDKELSYARLVLCEAAKVVLKNGFDIIGISAPERM